MGLTLLEIQALTASLAANGRVPSTVAPPAATGTVTGIIPAAGTTPTAGSGFTYTHTNGTGIYVFTFTTAFTAAPVVTGNVIAASDPNILILTAVTTSGFTANVLGSPYATAKDGAFNFTAQAVT